MSVIRAQIAMVIFDNEDPPHTLPPFPANRTNALAGVGFPP